MNREVDFSALAVETGLEGDDRLRERFRIVAEQGVLKHALPETFGGYGDGFADLYRTHRRLGE
ncbi:MAG: Isovaleryl-CoA dehydrogenase, partial [Proteobacteria bacterium]|nr:Isovaleryl-CoA dehydrogenase [Pseudomonadota bacterium]